MGLGSGGTATEERQLMQQPWGVNGGVVATHPSSQWHAAFFPPSQLRFPTTAAGDDEGVIKLWDSRQAEAVSTLEAHSGAAALAAPADAFGWCSWRECTAAPRFATHQKGLPAVARQRAGVRQRHESSLVLPARSPAGKSGCGLLT